MTIDLKNSGLVVWLAVLLLMMASCRAKVPPDSSVFRADTNQNDSNIAVKEGFTETPDGVQLYYRVVGTGTETIVAPLAVFHGTSLDRLAEGRRVVTYDPRGRGRSQTVKPEKVSLDHLLVDLDTVRRAVGSEEIAIIGWSGMGMETFVYALRNPQRVTRLVQLATVPPRFIPYGPEMMQDRQRRTDQTEQSELRSRIKAGDFENDHISHCRAENAVTLPPLLANPLNISLLPDVCGWYNESPEALGTYFGALFRSIDGFNWLADLQNVTVPRLVIHGAQDNISLTGNEEWVRGHSNARILVVNDAGHFPHYEKPEQTLSALQIFLDGHWPKNAKSIAH